MGLSDFAVVLICVLVAGLVVAAGAALYRVTRSEDFQTSIPTPSGEQQSYMRDLRLKNWAFVRHASDTGNTSSV